VAAASAYPGQSCPDTFQAALQLPGSNGQTERQITRLKLIKHQMFGRAKHNLLRARVLQAAQAIISTAPETAHRHCQVNQLRNKLGLMMPAC
jgi:hypothetical protein